jgi:hypothetical protein
MLQRIWPRRRGGKTWREIAEMLTEQGCKKNSQLADCKFSLPIANSGRDRRSATLYYWQVFLIQAQCEVIGFSGLYRQPGMPSNIC